MDIDHRNAMQKRYDVATQRAAQLEKEGDLGAALDELRQAWTSISQRIEYFSRDGLISGSDVLFGTGLLGSLEAEAASYKAEAKPQRYVGTPTEERASGAGGQDDAPSRVAPQGAHEVVLDRSAREGPVPPTARRGRLDSDRVANLLGIAFWLPMYVGFFLFGVLLWFATLGLMPIVALVALGPIVEMLRELTGRDIDYDFTRLMPRSTLESVLWWFLLALSMLFIGVVILAFTG